MLSHWPLLCLGQSWRLRCLSDVLFILNLFLDCSDQGWIWSTDAWLQFPWNTGCSAAGFLSESVSSLAPRERRINTTGQETTDEKNYRLYNVTSWAHNRYSLHFMISCCVLLANAAFLMQFIKESQVRVRQARFRTGFPENTTIFCNFSLVFSEQDKLACVHLTVTLTHLAISPFIPV